jgi:hypothetical protein
VTLEQESIFREEALQHHQRGRGPGELVRLPLWTTWAFWTLLTLFASLIAASVLVTLSEDVEAIAVVDHGDRSVTALVPATYSDDVEAGDEMSLSLPGVEAPIRLTIQSVGDPVAPGSHNTLPPSVDSVVAAQPHDSIPVSAELPSGYFGQHEATSITGTAVVHIEDRLLFEIVPALKGLFDSDG